jgi:ABC-type transport system involved in multi-copper enzyme maturation permease subunit
MKTLRDAWVVARFDLGESLRSRKVLVILSLYVLGAIAASILFTELLQTIESELAEQLLVAQTDRPGTLTEAVMRNSELRRVLTRLVRDPDLALSLLSVPPLALLYGWVALTFGPVFVVLTASDAISSEVDSGSARFALARTDRSAWALGKLFGQALLLLAGILAGAFASYVTGFIQLASFPLADTALWMLRYALGAFVYGFAFLGLTLGTSQLTRSVPWSRALAVLALAGVSMAVGVLDRDDVRERAPVLADSLRQLFPGAHRLDLWRPDFVDSGPAIAMLFTLGFAYFLLGHVRFARRDA